MSDLKVRPTVAPLPVAPLREGPELQPAIKMALPWYSRCAFCVLLCALPLPRSRILSCRIRMAFVSQPTMKKRASKTEVLERSFRVVTLGGGTGLSVLLRGLKEHVVRRPDELATAERPISDLAAIVTVTDDGGSSGRLRRENRILPPGDIRNCMVALSKDEALLGRLFQYRFHAGRGLIGHNFGNLFLAALTHVTGDFTEAIRVSSKVLAIRGRIFPSTLSNVHLVATLENGRVVHGETRITASRAPIKKLKLSTRGVRPLPKAVEAIKQADLILLGPGSLYTSILPNLLIPEIASAIAKSKAPRVYIANLMTQPGETAGYALADHLRAIQEHVPQRVIDFRSEEHTSELQSHHDLVC